jgi:L-seryl-tRNA(Ser) seleniumtransferase
MNATTLTDEQRTALRSIPAVDQLLADSRIVDAASSLDQAVVTTIVRQQQELWRAAVLGGRISATDSLVARVVDELRLVCGNRNQIVINGTGVIVHTNLGRAPVSSSAAMRMAAVGSSYIALETDLETGERGGRGREVEALIRALTGAERTLVVNNNAAAVLLTLTALASGGEVIVSRGEAVEIGGGFRVPDVLRQSGARLVEVGTTNRTYVADYAAAISDDTAVLLRVHASNFSIIGFTAQPELRELATLAHDRGVYIVEDVGSGCLIDTSQFGLDHEPTLQESIAAGVDVVCASGDKLLGGPQAGLILGRADVVARIARHPLARALRADKTCLAGLADTLGCYARGQATTELPVWWAISRDVDWLRARCQQWVDALGGRGSIVETRAVIGGGSLPGKTLPSIALALDVEPEAANDVARRLRLGDYPVVPRVADGCVTIDARTVLAGEDEALVNALRAALSGN